MWLTCSQSGADVLLESGALIQGHGVSLGADGDDRHQLTQHHDVVLVSLSKSMRSNKDGGTHRSRGPGDRHRLAECPLGVCGVAVGIAPPSRF